MSDNLKIVIAARHGHDSGTNLSEVGRDQVRKFVAKLLEMIPQNTRVIVLSSPRTRAMETAEMIATAFGVKHEVCEVLAYDEYDDGGNMKKAIKSLANGAEVAIAVTHFAAPSGIIDSFAHELGCAGIGRRECYKGNGFMIDLVNRTVTRSLV